jgi:SAM-dependent methyltransferase
MPDEYEGVLTRNYDALYGIMRDPSGDAAFYRALAQESGGPVLELGCGTGRVLLPIAALGIPCVGVDASPAMLAALRAKSPPPHLEAVEERMETFNLGERRFRLVTCPFRAFQHLLDVGAQLAALANIRRHLAPGGMFAFDVFDPKLAWLIAPGDTERLDATFSIDGVETHRFAKTRTDLATQIMEVTFRFQPAQTDGNTVVRLRWFYRYEIEHLLARAGFTDLTIYGGYDRRPWRPEGETVIVARVPASASASASASDCPATP